MIKKLKYQMDKISHNVLYYIHDMKKRQFFFRYLIKIRNFIKYTFTYKIHVIHFKFKMIT